MHSEQTTADVLSASPPVALRERAVRCDALARGEQILLLREDVSALVRARDARGETGPAGPTLRHDGFWLIPRWGAHDASEVADPYRDRIEALEELRRDDGRVRIQFYATVEYSERITEPGRLLALDGQHTLNSVGVERRAREAGESGVLFLLLRVFRRETAALLPERELPAGGGPWVRLQGSVARNELAPGDDDGTLEPVMGDERYLLWKAELLQLARSVHAM